MDVEEGHCLGRLGGGGERVAEKLVSQSRDQSNGEIQEWKRVQGTRIRADQELRRLEEAPCVSIPHHPSRERLVLREG